MGDKVYALAPVASWVENVDPHTNMIPYQSPTHDNNIKIDAFTDKSSSMQNQQIQTAVV